MPSLLGACPTLFGALVQSLLLITMKPRHTGMAWSEWCDNSWSEWHNNSWREWHFLMERMVAMERMVFSHGANGVSFTHGVFSWCLTSEWCLPSEWCGDTAANGDTSNEAMETQQMDVSPKGW